MKNIDGEIIVVDNNSTDGTRDFFLHKFNDVNFIWNHKNDGFAKANNKALAKASGDYILFLNPDTIVPEDCFEKCIAFIEEKKESVALGIKMIDGSGKFLKESKRDFPSPMTSLYKLTGLARLFPHSKTFAKYYLGHLDRNKNHEVAVLAGAFMMIPKKLLNAIGSFDERFFMYGEDIDLSYRIQVAGLKNFYFAESSIIHFKGESTKRGRLNYVRMFYKAMSVFAQKHYGSTKAGLYNFFIQAAILLGAGLAALAQILRWIGLKFIDAAIILMSFWFIKYLWNGFVKREVNYSPNMLIIAFPVFTAIFLASSYFAGLYDNGYRQSRLNKSTLVAILVILSVYSLLPESLRFSRGILLFGSLMAFIIMSIVRMLMLKWKVFENGVENNKINETIIAGTEAEFDEVTALLENAGMQERVLGRIETEKTQERKSMGNLDELSGLLKKYPVKEIIFCQGSLSYKEIIESILMLPGQTRFKIYTSFTHTLIGSEKKNAIGKSISNELKYQLGNPVSRRNKSLLDVTLSFFFIITFPVHFIFKKHPGSFFRNVFDVLIRRKTWIGYALEEIDLPPLKKGILTSTGLPATLNTLSNKNLRAADVTYAKRFNYLIDLRLLWLNYKLLS